jgi:S1-C subfamily serine protease
MTYGAEKLEVPMSEQPNLLAAFSRRLSAMVEQCAPSVVAVAGRRRAPSSGFVWRSDVVVTASDAVERDEDIFVITAQGEQVGATLAGRDGATDIAVLKARGAGTPLALPRTDQVSTGELALAIGRGSDGPMASLAMIAIAGGPWQSLRGGRIDRLVRLDRGIDRRQEGGVIVNAEGGLIGMAVPGPRRAALAIPAPTIERVAEQLLARGRIPRGYLGLGLQPVRLDEALVQSASPAAPQGLLVVSLDPNGPGRRAGMLIGDILTAWNGEPVRRVRDVFTRLGAETTGQTVALSIIRAGQTASTSIEISERPMS